MNLVLPAISLLLAVPFWKPDPAANLQRTKSEARRFSCEELDIQAGQARRPGLLRPVHPRGERLDRRVTVCQERLLEPGMRSAQDDAVLEDLELAASDVASRVAGVFPDFSDRTWMVEVYYPNAQVVPKIGFAHKTALVGQGLSVTDRAPLLAAGDVDVLTRMAPAQAYPAACQRYAATGSVREGTDVLLAVVLRDPRETVLHTGVCVDGRWTWLQ